MSFFANKIPPNEHSVSASSSLCLYFGCVQQHISNIKYSRPIVAVPMSAGSGSVIDLSEDPLLNKDLRYLVVLQVSFRNPLLQQLLLSGTHYQTPSPRWLRYHLSELRSHICHCYIMPVGVHTPLPKYPSGNWQLLSRSRSSLGYQRIAASLFAIRHWHWQTAATP